MVFPLISFFKLIIPSFVSYFSLWIQCSAYTASASSEKTWTMRTTFPEYVVALATIVGSVLFSVLNFLIISIFMYFLI